MGDRETVAALRHHVASATFALTTLCGHAELKLDFVKAEASAGVASYFAIRNPAADANDHE